MLKLDAICGAFFGFAAVVPRGCLAANRPAARRAPFLVADTLARDARSLGTFHAH